MRFVVVDELDFGIRLAGENALHAGGRDDLRAGRTRAVGQRARERAHAADGYAPFARAAADDVVNVGAVLQERGVVRVGQHTDFGVGEDRAAHAIILEHGLNRFAQRLLDQQFPGGHFIFAREALLHLLAREQRFEQGRPDAPGEQVGVFVEALVRSVLVVAPCQLAEGCSRFLRRDVADEQRFVLAVAHGGREGGDGAAAALKVQAEVGDDFLREHADEIGVARQAGVHAGKDFGGDGCAAGMGLAFEHEDGAPRARQISGCHEAVVPAADDDSVVVGSKHCADCLYLSSSCIAPGGG